jgi:hypothetical protein
MPWVDMTDKLETAAGLYAKATPMSDGEHHYNLISYLYSITILRHATILSSTWTARGWGPLALSTMMNPRNAPPVPLGNDLATLTQREKLSSLSRVQRSHVAEVLSAAHGPWLLHLGHRERINILERLASMYAILGFHRKEVYVLREVIGSIMDLIAVGRTEGESGTFFSPRLTDSPGGSLSATAQPADVAVRETERSDGNRSVAALVRYICKVHGVDLDLVKLVDPGSTQSDSQTTTEDDGGLEEPFGWPEIQVGIVREALAVAEALPGMLLATTPAGVRLTWTQTRPPWHTFHSPH